MGPSLLGGPPPGSSLLSDPKLELYRREKNVNTLVATQDNWSEHPNAATTAQVAKDVSAFTIHSGSKDAAFVVTLPPGIYTVVGSSAIDSALPGGTGVVLVEVYVVP